MSDPANVNAQITDSISKATSAVLSPDVVQISGSGKAYQSIAQSMAIAVQDATDNLRNLSTISTTAQGVAISKLLETKDTTYAQILEKAQDMMVQANDAFKTSGSNAADILKSFSIT